VLFFKKVVFFSASSGRDIIRIRSARKAPDWVDTVPSCFNIQYKLICWPELPEEHRTAGVLQALSRMTVENFDYQQMSSWTGLDAGHARSFFELCLLHGWIKPAVMADDYAA
jgi:hypothetical protein